MNKYIIYIVVVFVTISCKNSNQQSIKKPINKTQFNIKNYLGSEKWIEITKKNNKYINYKRCNADNRFIKIIKTSFTENTGQETFNCKLIEIKKIDSLDYNIIINKDCSYSNIFNLQIIDLEHKIIKWNIYNNLSFFSTPESYINNYTKVMQPCTDCFPPEECP